MSSIESFPLIRGLTHHLNDDIHEFGLQVGVGKTLKRYKTRLNISLPPETEKHLKESSVLLVANHPYYIEPLGLMAALPPRQDAYFIGNTFFRGLVPSLDHHLIPLFVRHRYFAKGPGILGRFMDTVHPYDRLSKSEEHRKNAQQLRLAANLISKGSLVTIFPEAGSTRANPSWSSGLEYLLRLIDTDVNAVLVKAYIQGTSNLDYLRIFPMLGKYLPEISVIFSGVTPIRDLVCRSKRSALTSTLEHQYKTWTATLV
jgi:hypothetical protein